MLFHINDISSCSSNLIGSYDDDDDYLSRKDENIYKRLIGPQTHSCFSVVMKFHVFILLPFFHYLLLWYWFQKYNGNLFSFLYRDFYYNCMHNIRSPVTGVWYWFYYFSTFHNFRKVSTSHGSSFDVPLLFN